jgi:hypothetical protein
LKKIMKRLIALLLITGTITGCTLTQVAYRTDRYNLLRIGMTQWEVEDQIGPPACYLDAWRSAYGYEEILLYHNRYNEPFALEFVNDYLVAAHYVYDGRWYPMYPLPNRPTHGHPAFPPSYRPNRPYYPPTNLRATPPADSRPGNNPPSYHYERSSSPTRSPANGQPAPTTSRPSSRPSGNDDNPSRAGESNTSSDRNAGTTRRESSSPPSSERSSGQNSGTTTRGDNPRSR